MQWKKGAGGGGGGVEIFKLPEPLKLLWDEGGKDKQWRGTYRR